MDPSSAPLADYFWIAGIDSLSYSEQLRLVPNTGEKLSNGSSSPPVASTIEEDKTLELEDDQRALASDRHNSFGRLSSGEPRLSIHTVVTEADSKQTSSNRSSATITGIQLNGTGLSDFDFDRALRKFAAERDSFLDELSFSAGTIVPNRPVMHPRAQRVINEEPGGLKAVGGSIRRRISFRDLNSMKRQPSMVRSSSIRTALSSRRLSNYNSVIPTPSPLNISPNMHPLKRKFEPALLDRYPPKSMVEETRRRGPFPDYVPMFAFPNDVSIVSADERPRSTWHGFAMTSGDNSRLYGICVIMWIPLNPRASQEVEQKCEEWRQNNMSNEERELASSLGVRLAVERAKLSQLLARLPTVISGSPAREALEDDISATEEKIGLMAELLRPVRHGAAAKIDGLTDGETGLWIPRAYGILGRDGGLTTFWKEWLRAVIVPMNNGAILRVPPSSPKVGMWQPLERYVVNLCAEAPSPVSSKTQVEITIRELRLFARKEAINETPGSRSTDLYALFRSLSIPNIVNLFEFALSESRIILLSSHTAMLHLVSKALSSLLYPLTWSNIFIPVLPARLLSVLEAPCPYIVGIERRYDRIELPDEDFVLVDLDQNQIDSTAKPTPLPKQQRRKLVSLLQLAAPHHNRYGVPIAPPPYAIETFPCDAFSSENSSLFTHNPPPSTLAKYVSLNSTQFGDQGSSFAPRPPVFNAFLQSKNDHSRLYDRPSTGSTSKTSSPPSPKLSPTSQMFSTAQSTQSRADSGFALTATLREKRSGHFDGSSRRSSSVRLHISTQIRSPYANQPYVQFGLDRAPTLRRPSLPFNHHVQSASTSSLSTDSQSIYQYAPSTFAPSTLAASTIMPNLLMQPVRNTATTTWAEGHSLEWKPNDMDSICSICDDRSEEGIYRCSNCSINSHSRCTSQICLVCPIAFHPDQIRAAFVRCFASLFYTYRKFLQPATGDQKKAGKLYRFNMDGFLKSMPNENSGYMQMMQQTQGFNEFIHEREMKKGTDPEIMLFDQVILAKRNRGRTSIFSKSSTNFLEQTADHTWRSASAMPPSSRFPGDYRQVISRIPAKLDPALMREPRVNQGAPKINPSKARRKPIPSMLGRNGTVNGGPP